MLRLRLEGRGRERKGGRERERREKREKWEREGEVEELVSVKNLQLWYKLIAKLSKINCFGDSWIVCSTLALR